MSDSEFQAVSRSEMSAIMKRQLEEVAGRVEQLSISVSSSDNASGLEALEQEGHRIGTGSGRVLDLNPSAGLICSDSPILSFPSNNSDMKNISPRKTLHPADHDQGSVFGVVLPGAADHDGYQGLLVGGDIGSEAAPDDNSNYYYYDYGAVGTTMLGFGYRGQMYEKFLELKSLIPNQTKTDRASIVKYAANYIQELLRTVDELRTLVQRKRYSSNTTSPECNKKQRHVTLQKEEPENWGSSSTLVGSLRSSWIQRKSKSTSVDVRIVEDEVNIRLTQRRTGGSCCCFLSVAEVLQLLELEPLQLASGNIGDCYTFMINCKIPDESAIYASAIATKFMEAMTSAPYSSL